MENRRTICCHCKFYKNSELHCLYLDKKAQSNDTCCYFEYDRPIDYEQRRYEIAKDCMAKNIDIWKEAYRNAKNYREISDNLYEYSAACALLYADALIEELKKGK